MTKMDHFVRRIRNKVRPPLPVFRFLNRAKEQFECPLCGYKGPFMDLSGFAGGRKHAKCPQCAALERHGLQYLVIGNVLKTMNVSEMKMLHFAPKAFFRQIFSQRFGEYETADLSMKGVDYHIDLQSLPFEAATYDFIFASHVLEHILDDKRAIEEIRRVLKPDGAAILPVPVVCEKTIEYSKGNPHEAYHVRAPGLDYFERYKQYFKQS